MSDVTLTYKGSDILELSDSGSATLKTGGKYCEGDIDVEYVKPSGGGGSISKTVYTQVEDWTTLASGGNMLNFSNTYFDDSFLGVTIITVTNNSASSNYANYGFKINTSEKAGSVLVRNLADARGSWTANTDFFISVGSLVTVYKIPQEDL